jgi:hypothetical protein
MGIFALRSATMDSRVPLHASRCGLICSQKTRRVRGPQLQRCAPSSAREEWARAACAAQPCWQPAWRSHAVVMFRSSLQQARASCASCAAQLRPLSRSELWASRSDLGSRAQPRGQVRLDWDTRKVRATCSVVRLRWGCRAEMIFCEMSPLTTALT